MISTATHTCKFSFILRYSMVFMVHKSRTCYESSIQRVQISEFPFTSPQSVLSGFSAFLPGPREQFNYHLVGLPVIHLRKPKKKKVSLNNDQALPAIHPGYKIFVSTDFVPCPRKKYVDGKSTSLSVFTCLVHSAPQGGRLIVPPLHFTSYSQYRSANVRPRIFKYIFRIFKQASFRVD